MPVGEIIVTYSGGPPCVSAREVIFEPMRRVLFDPSDEVRRLRGEIKKLQDLVHELQEALERFPSAPQLSPEPSEESDASTETL